MTITFTRSDLARKTSIELSGLFQQVSRSIKATQRDLDAAQSLLRMIEQEQAHRAQSAKQLAANAPKPAQ